MRTIGKYRLVEPLASGGMADVWRAEVSLAAGVVKEVALKLVRGEHEARSDFVRMFVEEARLAARLTHANVVQVFEFDEFGGQYFLAMELVHGRHLGRVVDRARELGLRIGLPRALHVGAEAAKALAYVHRLSDGGRPLELVHRDVSPHNLLLSFEGEVKLADFGIARAMSLAGLTEPGTLKGKLAYMAPEQARGEPVNARADVFSLGVILWELCAGRRLFARDSDAATLAALLEGPAPSPPSAWNEGVPPELDALVLGCLERDAARRVATADEVGVALAGLLLRLARSPEDWDLRAFMHRLWPEGAMPARAEELERTRVRPRADGSPGEPSPSPSPSPPPAPDPDPSAVTRTVGPAPVRRRRRWRALGFVAALAAASVGGVLVVVRGAGAPPPASPGPRAVPEPAGAAVPHGEAPPSGSDPTADPGPAPGGPAAATAGPATGLGPDAEPLPSPAPAPEANPAAPIEPSAGTESARAGDGPDLRPGTLHVNALPWGNVAVDGRAVGETPLTVELPPGRHRVRVTHPSYGVRESAVTVAPGRETSWTPNLLKR